MWRVADHDPVGREAPSRRSGLGISSKLGPRKGLTLSRAKTMPRLV